VCVSVWGIGGLKEEQKISGRAFCFAVARVCEQRSLKSTTKKGHIFGPQEASVTAVYNKYDK
jgi:hypothetical protein